MRSPRERVRRPQMRVRRIPELSVNRMVPNILTLLALCAGMTAIRFALNGNFQGAVYAIIVAGVLDGLDTLIGEGDVLVILPAMAGGAAPSRYRW